MTGGVTTVVSTEMIEDPRIDGEVEVGNTGIVTFSTEEVLKKMGPEEVG